VIVPEMFEVVDFCPLAHLPHQLALRAVADCWLTKREWVSIKGRKEGKGRREGKGREGRRERRGEEEAG
jgi:hypothetical protein